MVDTVFYRIITLSLNKFLEPKVVLKSDFISHIISHPPTNLKAFLPASFLSYLLAVFITVHESTAAIRNPGTRHDLVESIINEPAQILTERLFVSLLTRPFICCVLHGHEIWLLHTE